MITIKIIDLLNKIANGERFDNCKMKFKGIEPKMVNEYVIYDKLYEEDLELNDEVEIIEEEQKDNFTGWKMYQNGKEVISMDCSPKEDKKIEKLNIPCNFSCTKNGMTKEDREQLDFNFKNIQKIINELIDEVNKLKEGK